MPDDEIDTSDDRLAFVHPDVFEAAAFVAELVQIRPDASWEELVLDEQIAAFGNLPTNIAPQILAALRRTGRSRIFTHQAEAVMAALDGQHVVQATSAGSGKSLGFIIPILDRLLRDPHATAMLIFPLRALANDQLESLARLGIVDDPWVSESAIDLVLSEGDAPIRIARRDGSTSVHDQAEARRHARILITTPDSLHEVILRFALHKYKDGSSWRRLLGGLQFVVLDEIHTYQGVFGSAVGQVLRRLRRTTSTFGTNPQFLTASATIGNPTELASRLTGVGPFTLVDNDGSARRKRMILVCNPPIRASEQRKQNDESGEPRRLAPQTIAIDLVCDAALGSANHDPVRTIGFSPSRNAVFGLSQRIRNRLTEMRRNDLAQTVAPYAATFLADDRQDAEKRIRDGSTLAVISTNALELGIDIPDLSFALLEGYPGQISSFRQRIGRVGRAGEGVAVLIVGDDPLQQYLARDPDALLGLLEDRPEDVIINPAAPAIAERFGLVPAQEELGGVAFEDAEFFGEELVRNWLAEVRGAPAVQIHDRNYFQRGHSLDPYMNLRTAAAGRTFIVYRIVKRERVPIGVLGEASAPRDAFVPAIWTGPDGDLYRVIDYQFDPPEIHCEGPVEVAYQTRGILVDRVEVEQEHREPISIGRGSVGYGLLSISRQVVAYKEQYFSGAEVTKDLERGWPPIEFVTDGLFLRLDRSWTAGMVNRDGAIRAFEHVLLSAIPMVVSCDPYDFDASSDRDTVYLYDSFSGGLRMSEAAFDRLGEVLQVGSEIIATCPCDDGCPGCVMLNRRPDGNAGLSKTGALDIFHVVLREFSSTTTSDSNAI